MKRFNLFLISLVSTFAALPAFAQEAVAEAGTRSGASGLIALGAGLAVTIAAVGGALGQGRAVAAALDGIARNPAAQPKMFLPLILGLALMETLVLFAFIIAIQLAGKV